jgi:hypothetical protein
MQSQRVQVKLYASNPDALELDSFVSVFHRWIQNGTLEDELPIDVANYSHVHRGPGVVLIGHGGDYYLDIDEDRPGLMFSRKREFQGDFTERLEDAVRRAEHAARLLESDEQMDAPPHFARGELWLRIPDRLHAPNTDDTLTQLEPILRPVLTQYFGTEAFTLTREGTEREVFTVRARRTDA